MRKNTPAEGPPAKIWGGFLELINQYRKAVRLADRNPDAPADQLQLAKHVKYYVEMLFTDNAMREEKGKKWDTLRKEARENRIDVLESLKNLLGWQPRAEDIIHAIEQVAPVSEEIVALIRYDIAEVQK